MDHWSRRYLISQPDGDCTDLVERVLEERFGRRVRLPRRQPTVRGMDRQVRDLREDFADPVDPGDAREGDAVLMRATARAHAVGHHIGVLCIVSGKMHVMHKLKRAGVRLTEIRALPAAASLEMAGIYRIRDDARD